MHPSLRIDALGTLPLSTRRIALAAAKGSVHELLRLRRLISPNASSKAALLMLPVLYILLDPAKIPTPDQLDVLVPEETRTVISAAALAWDTLSAILVAQEAALDLWPRIWAWYQFISTYRDHLRNIHYAVPAEETMLSDIVLYAGHFSQDELITTAIKATPGFHVAVARAWNALLDEDALDLKHAIVSLLTVDDASNPEVLDELAEGAGGSLADLARVIVRQIDVVAGDGKVGISNDNAFIICGVLVFVTAVEEATGDPTSRFFQELMRQNLFEFLVRALCALSESSDKEADTLAINKCFLLLRRIMRYRNMHLLLSYAVELGFLRAIILCGRPSLSKVHHHVRFFLRDLLPASTIYCDVIPIIEKALAVLQNLITADAFVESNMFVHWTFFSSIVQERITLLESFDRRDVVGMKACDNCNLISEKADFQRCSGCESFYYCDRDCQRADWKEGGHRDACSLFRTLGLSQHLRLDPRERSFMRAVVHQDYTEKKPQICRDIVQCLQEFPDAGYFVVFDYVSTPVVMTVHSLAAETWGVHDTVRNGGAEWKEYLARAVRSKGCMTVHVMRGREGNMGKYWVVPLRANTSDLQDGLERIAARDEGPHADYDLDVELAALFELLKVDEDLPFEEIH